MWFLLLWACNSELKGGEDCETVTRSCAEVEEAFAAAGAGVVVSCTDGAEYFSIEASGVPDYDSNQTTPNEIAAQSWTVDFPLSPTCAEESEDVSQSRGEIAFTVNGIPIYGPSDANGGDAIINEGPSMDDCEGHADEQCVYHHHSEPVCVFGEGTEITNYSESEGHPPIVGFSLDGFAIYGIDPEDREGENLDDCNGQFEEGRGYHYHMTDDYPYTIGCYAGADRGNSLASASGCN